MRTTDHLFLKKAVLFLSVLLLKTSSFAQIPPVYISDSLQNILNAALPTNYSNPGAVMGIVVPGQWSWFGASGNAISGTTMGQPLTMATPSTRFRVGSITKNMVAASILKLEQDGLLSIEDPISMYLRPTLVTDTIASSGIVLIRHLLNHTSGIANSGANLTCQSAVLANPLLGFTLEEAIYCGASQGELFAPGTSWTYSNTNYSILAMIIKNVSGLSCADYITQNIITPLGLTNTEIPTTNQVTGPHMGCYWNLGTWTDLTIINPTVYEGWADVVSNTGDLTTYYDSLLSGAIINAAQLVKMKTIDAAANGYGLGTDFYTITGDSFFGHYGEVANTSGMFFMDIQTTICPNGYYIAYNFNTQGADMQNKIDVPVYLFLNNYLGINETNEIKKEVVFPNPIQKNSVLSVNQIEANSIINLKDMNGKILQSIPTLNAEKTVQIPIGAIDSGLYWIEIINTNATEILKLIIE